MTNDAVEVDRDGVHFPDSDVPVCDILIDGRRVMSMLPANQRRAAHGRAMVRWPESLRPYLRGIGHVTVREHGSDVVHFDAEVQFSASHGRTRVVDQQGRPLSVNKWGTLARSFDDSEDVQQQIEMTAEILRDLNDIGVTAYVAYGTLLGAVRAGKVIGHDTDADVSYLSKYSHPADIARESFHIQRELRRRGWNIDRDRFSKLTVTQLHRVDIFVSYFVGDRYHLDQWAEGPLRREHVVPLSTVTLEGYDLPAPADPEAVLALIYGPGWRTPDPSFTYDEGSAHLERIRGWFGGLTVHKRSWNRYWTHPSRADDRRPSSFSRWVAERVDPDMLLVDVGCGDAADTIALATLGIHSIGYDFAGLALGKARQAAAAAKLSRLLRFKRLSFSDTRVTLAEGARLAATPGSKAVTARLVLDALPPDGYANFWHLLRLATAHGGDAYLEFRAEPGIALSGTRLPMWRRLVEIDDVRQRLAKIGGVITDEQIVKADRRAGALTRMHRLAVHFDVSGPVGTICGDAA